MAGAADALQAARHRRRRLDLHDQIDRAHVDARAPATTWRRARGSCAALQRVFDFAAAARVRSSRGASARASRRPARSAPPASRSASRRLLTKISVERCARISSSRRGWMLLQIEGRTGPCAAGPLGIAIGSASRAMSSTGTSIFSSSDFGCRASMIGDRPPASASLDCRELVVQFARGRPLAYRRSSTELDDALPPSAAARGASAPPRNRATSSTGRRGRQPDALKPAARQALQAFERQGEVRAALGRQRARGSRRRSLCRSSAAHRARATSAAGTATPAS